MTAEIREMLRLDILGTAYWRSENARQFPDDARNDEAEDLLEKLEASVSEVDDELLTAWLDLFQDQTERDMAEWHDELRRVGFQSFPSSAADLVRAFIARMTGG